MTTSDTVQPIHRQRLAVVYVRQSSPNQALMNQESLKLQYDFEHRAHAAGWDSEIGRAHV